VNRPQRQRERAARQPNARSGVQTPAFERFERRFARHLSLYGTAGSSEDRKTRALARKALERLKANPSLRVLAGPDGPVLYEDPLLDSAWACMELAQRSGLGLAAEGEDLDEHWYHWLSLGPALIRGRFKRNWDVLKNFVPKKDVSPETAGPNRDSRRCRVSRARAEVRAGHDRAKTPRGEIRCRHSLGRYIPWRQ
jgi:hypothetical protein